MSDTIKFHKSTDAIVIQILLDLASHEPNQKKDIQHTFWNVVNHFRDENIQIHNAEVYSNDIGVY